MKQICVLSCAPPLSAQGPAASPTCQNLVTGRQHSPLPRRAAGQWKAAYPARQPGASAGYEPAAAGIVRPAVGT